MTLRLPRAVLAAIEAHAARAAPEEACGVLVGRDGVVARAVAVRNAHPRPEDAFLLEPQELLAAVLAAEGDGVDVLGFYHSHPRGPPRPSATDAREATWPDAVHLLVWPGGHGAWRSTRGRLVPIAVEVDRRGSRDLQGAPPP